MTGVLGSGLAFPLAVDRRGGIALAPGEADVEQAILIILGTAPGERPLRPEFGCRIHDYVFEAVDARTLAHVEAEIRESLDRWEPRLEVTEVGFDLSGVDEGRVVIDISYRLMETNQLRNLVYPFYLVPEEGGE
ncbi:MAG TPA: GPW/gp25 family protein [Solirubrobacterales bacterium]|nr:GPW/gp25 family protein [Solirubrobacterales bacterium]